MREPEKRSLACSLRPAATKELLSRAPASPPGLGSGSDVHEMAAGELLQVEVILGACSSPGALEAEGPREGGEFVCLLLSEQLSSVVQGPETAYPEVTPGPFSPPAKTDGQTEPRFTHSMRPLGR